MNSSAEKKAAFAERRYGQSEIALSDEWATPEVLFEYFNARYGPFGLDAAAAPWNAKCRHFLTKRQNGLRRPWARRTWCNPPYSRGNKPAFTAYARRQVVEGRVELACLLIPHDTAEGWWHDNVEAPEGRFLGISKQLIEVGVAVQTCWQGLTVEIVTLRGRQRFRHETGVKSGARYSSVLVTFARPGVLKALIPTSGQKQEAA